ncbi:hypothetical protein Pmar_PMAR008763, partial [Perkinsus marinus ATCC 50983]
WIQTDFGFGGAKSAEPFLSSMRLFIDSSETRFSLYTLRGIPAQRNVTLPSGVHAWLRSSRARDF